MFLCSYDVQELTLISSLTAVAFSGSTIGWLRDRLELINSASETEALALSIPSNENMYLVPAFSGLFAPHWRPDARGCMVGLTASHTKAHIVRAALESSAYQAREVFDAMVLDSNVQLKEMRVDGGATANKFLMQFQSDILDVPVVRPFGSFHSNNVLFSNNLLTIENLTKLFVDLKHLVSKPISSTGCFIKPLC